MTPAPAKPLPAAQSELLLGQSPGCAWLLERDGTFHVVYGDAARVFGRPAAELARLNFIHLCEPTAQLSWRGHLSRVFAGETHEVTARFGADRPGVWVTMFPVRLPGGAIAFAGCLAHEALEGRLVLRTLEALENDRARLSQLLHDRIAQNLSAAGLQLDLLRMDLGETALPVSQRIGEIQAMLESIIEVVRDVHRQLNPAAAERVGLRAALDRLAGCLRTDFKGTVRVFADAAAPPPQVAAALYRIAQEAAGQAARRTGCSAIEILLKSLRSGPALEIRDDAPAPEGADSDFRSGGLESIMMRYYAERAGIELEIDRAAAGTVVRALYRRECEASPPGQP